jgi:hypothetical protein
VDQPACTLRLLFLVLLAIVVQLVLKRPLKIFFHELDCVLLLKHENHEIATWFLNACDNLLYLPH